MRHPPAERNLKNQGNLAFLVVGSRPWPCKRSGPRRPRMPDQTLVPLLTDRPRFPFQPLEGFLVATSAATQRRPFARRRLLPLSRWAGREAGDEGGAGLGARSLPPRWGKARMGVNGRAMGLGARSLPPRWGKARMGVNGRGTGPGARSLPPRWGKVRMGVNGRGMGLGARSLPPRWGKVRMGVNGRGMGLPRHTLILFPAPWPHTARMSIGGRS